MKPISVLKILKIRADNLEAPIVDLDKKIQKELNMEKMAQSKGEETPESFCVKSGAPHDQTIAQYKFTIAC